MTIAEFGRAVDRGMGRAALCLMERDPGPYIPELIDACLFDGSFHMSEANRAPYLARLVELAKAEDAVVEALVAALPTTEDERYDLPQRLGILGEFAKRGNVPARDALYDRAIKDDAGVLAVASLGVSGLQWLIDTCPDLFRPERWDDAWYWFLRAEDASGKEAVAAILTEDLRELRRLWDERPVSKDDDPSITDVDELLRLFETNPVYGEARKFGRDASEEARRRWAERMLKETEPKILWAMSAAFRLRPWPLDVRPIFSRIDGDDRGSLAWRRVLAKAVDPQMRAFALERLRMNPPDGDALDFLAGSYEPGDEALILDALHRVDPEDEGACHDLGMSIRSLAQSVGPERFIPHLEWSIEANPCSFCRNGAMELLLQAGALKEEYRREAAYDAEPDTQALVRSPD